MERTIFNQQAMRGIIPDFCQLPRVFMLVLLSELLALLFTLLTYQIDRSFWLELGVHSLFILWVSLASGAILCALRSWLNSLSVVQVTLFTTLSIALVSFTSSILALTVFFNQTLQWQLAEHSWFIFRNTLVAVLITLVWMRYLYLRQQVLNGIVSEGEARFKALQARIQPHFLFNTLNTIASLITINAERAEETLEHLSVLLRSSLKPSVDRITLAHEIELCRNYLDIEAARLGDKLKVHWNIDLNPELYQLPPFTLQPVIENAVYHGIQLLAEGGVIEIEIHSMTLKAGQPAVKIKVTNPVPKNRGRSGNQIAQTNIQQRLNIRYGSLATMDVSQTETHYTVELVIPELVDELANN